MENLFSFVLILAYIITIIQSTQVTDKKSLGGWKCILTDELPYAIRLNSNLDIECLSTDGLTCVEMTDSVTCVTEIKYIQDNNLALPLYCGSFYYNLYNSTGYDNTSNWCYLSVFYYLDQWHCANETGLSIAVRLDRTTNNIECVSYDNENCIYYNNSLCDNINDLIGSIELYFLGYGYGVFTPLRCGYNFLQQFGYDSYYYPYFHWCKVGLAYFFGTYEWQCDNELYLNLIWRLNPNGHIECFSLDGINCAINHSNGDDCINYIENNYDNFKPLECGNIAVFGFNPYSKRYNHWCYKLMNYFLSNLLDP